MTTPKVAVSRGFAYEVRGTAFGRKSNRRGVQAFDPWVIGSFVKVAEHVWEERDLDGTVVATHWTTTKRDRNQQTALEIDRDEAMVTVKARRKLLT